jgi:Zn-dependent protease with chaperone function
VRSPLFSGPTSLRDPAERLAFWLTLVFALPAAGALGFIIHEKIGISEVALFIVLAMLYVTVARGRLLGSSVRIHEAQYPRVFAIVSRACAALDIPMPLVFVREDVLVPAAMLGLGEPYSLVLSSHWIETFQDDELAFVIGRQLGHIAAGHTRFISLLSVNGNENPIIAFIFGAWLRRCELTCDRVGLLVCGSIDAAVRAIAVGSFHKFGRHVNLEQFAEQGRDVHNDSILRWGEWLGAEPYATKRITWMYAFVKSRAYEVAEQWFLRESASAPPMLREPGSATVTPTECAGWWRRLGALAIDLIVVLNLVNFALGSALVHSDTETANARTALSTQSGHQAAKETLDFRGGILVLDESGIHFAPGFLKNPLAGTIARLAPRSLFIAAYLALLVAVAGQTFGMMIAGVRVVTSDFRKPGIWLTIWRYTIAFMLCPLIIVLSPFLRRVMLHDYLSNTRLVTVERVTARSLASQA